MGKWMTTGFRIENLVPLSPGCRLYEQEAGL
jgi:hypothetical protein